MELKDVFSEIYPLSDETLAAIQEKTETVHFNAGETIIAQGKKSKMVYFVSDGIVRCYFDEDGRQSTSVFSIGGNVFASLSTWLYNKGSLTSWEAIENTNCYAIDFNDFDFLCEKYNDLMMWKNRYMMYQLYVLERRHTLIGIGDAYTRYKQYFVARGKVMHQIPLKYLAQVLNITQVQLSRIRRRMAREK